MNIILFDGLCNLCSSTVNILIKYDTKNQLFFASQQSNAGKNLMFKYHIKDDAKSVSNEKAIELKAIALFQNIDALGNYSNANWFLSLNRIQIIKFIRDLIDIWNYRAQLTAETKRNICPPNGDPFRSLSVQYINTEPNLWNIKKVVLEVLDKMVNSGTDKDSKTLGAYYVLGALTLVNNEAATSLPWLFQSVNYF